MEKMNKFSLDRIFSNKKFAIVVSVFVAIIAWFIVVMVGDSGGVVTVYDVPITFATEKTKAQQLDLDVISIEPRSVAVKIRGPRYKIGLITEKDIVVSPVSMINVTSEGTYNISLVASFKTPQRDIYIDSVIPESASFVVDTLETKVVTLLADAPNVKIEPGYISDESVCQPEKLVVSGPKKSMDELDYIKLEVNASASLNSSKTFEAALKFISVDGVEMDSSLFKYNSDIEFKVSVPVYKEKQVPLKVMYKNAPNHLNLDLLNASINPPSVNIAGSPDLLDNISEINIGYIDLRELEIGKTFSFSLKVPSGYKNVDQVDSVDVSFDSGNWGARQFSIDDIKLNNVPAEYDVRVDSQAIRDVRFVGLVDYLNNLDVADITATSDLSNISVKEGKQLVPVSIGIINKDGVWAVGEYKCSITARKK